MEVIEGNGKEKPGDEGDYGSFWLRTWKSNDDSRS